MPRYAKISTATGGELQARCAGAAFAANMPGFSLVQRGSSGKRRCTLFSSTTTLCKAGEKRPPICRKTSYGAYKIKA
jgi:Fe-S-cluster containining protein